MARVTLSNLTKKYGEKIAVDSINLDAPDKSFTSLVGAPGAGKTTILRIISGLDRPTSGRVYIADEDVTDLPPKERDVAMVFQSFALYPTMTVFKNIAYPLRKRKISEPEIEKKVKEAAGLLHIECLLSRYPATLSGGEAQRVAIARAIVRRPRVYLFDEPLTNLDAKLRVEMRAELKRLQRELGQTIIYTTPSPVEALAMTDYVAMIRSGKMEQFGIITDVYEKPINLFVAEYLGYPPMNIFDASILERKGKLLLDASAFTLDITGLKDRLPREIYGKDIKVGVRPENIEISKKVKKRGRWAFRGLVKLVELLGSDTIIHIRIEDLDVRVFKPYPTREFDADDDVQISLDMEKAYFFDKKSGRLI